MGGGEEHGVLLWCANEKESAVEGWTGEVAARARAQRRCRAMRGGAFCGRGKGRGAQRRLGRARERASCAKVVCHFW